METNATPHDLSGPQANADGFRTFGAQMTLDARGIKMLDSWFRQSLPVTSRPVTEKPVQLRGIDLVVRLAGQRGAKSVGIDLKADNKFKGNISVELISQDRPNRDHDQPVVGWSGKDMPLVATLFMRTGDMVIMNMTLFYPWLYAQMKDIVEGRASAFSLGWLSATPNETYESFNIIVPIITLLAHAPGCLYVRARDVLSAEKCRELLPAVGFDKPLQVTGAL